MGVSTDDGDGAGDGDGDAEPDDPGEGAGDKALVQPPTRTSATARTRELRFGIRARVRVTLDPGSQADATLALMDAHELADVSADRARKGSRYEEFIRVRDLSVGLYELPAGGTDPQSPHTEDEVYHVVSGRAIIRVGGEDREVGPGSVVYVAATVPHRFHSITDDLSVLVFFAPAEGSLANDAG